MKLSQAVDKVIALAKIISEYWETELPKHHPNYPFANPGEEDKVPPPPDEKKLAKLIASMPEETAYQIALILNLGRRYFGANELDKGYKEVRLRYDSPREFASLVVRDGSLVYSLEEGLSELKKHNVDIDNLPLKPTRVRK